MPLNSVCLVHIPSRLILVFVQFSIKVVATPSYLTASLRAPFERGYVLQRSCCISRGRYRSRGLQLLMVFAQWVAQACVTDAKLPKGMAQRLIRRPSLVRWLTGEKGEGGSHLIVHLVIRYKDTQTAKLHLGVTTRTR